MGSKGFLMAISLSECPSRLSRWSQLYPRPPLQCQDPVKGRPFGGRAVLTEQRRLGRRHGDLLIPNQNLAVVLVDGRVVIDDQQTVPEHLGFIHAGTPRPSKARST